MTMRRKTRSTSLISVLTDNIILIACVVAIAASIGLWVAYITPATYEAEAKLRVRPPKGLAQSLWQESSFSGNAAVKQQMSTYIEIIRSREVMEAVARSSHAGVAAVPSYEQMLSGFIVQPVKDSEVLRIAFRAESPQLAQRVVDNTLVVFQDRLAELNRSEQKSVKSLLAERVADAKNELERAEKELEAYKKNNKVISISDETKAAVDKLYQMYRMAAENHIGLMAAGARLSSAEQQLSSEKPGFIADSPVIDQYKNKIASLETEYVTLLPKYTEHHPKVQAVKEAIAAARRMLDAETGKIARAEAPTVNPVHQRLLQNKIQAEADMASAYAQERALTGMISDNERRLSQMPTKELEVSRLLRNIAVAQDIYVTLAKRYEEARISEAMYPAEVQVIDRAALLPTPVSPRKINNVLLAGLFGLFTGLGIALMRKKSRQISYQPSESPESWQHTGGLPPRRLRQRTFNCSEYLAASG